MRVPRNLPREIAAAPMDEEAIFLEALEQPSPQARSAFLDAACGGNHELRRSVEKLLRMHEQAGDFLGGKPPGLSVTIERPDTERLGTQIGPYKLLQQIGEGGFGVVFMAEQYSPVRRKVALKVIKPGMDTREVIARFDAERQALALMDHSHIARVLDAGETESGRPYFVMELVKGVPITDYCDRNSLNTRERLALFVQVCQAVQHAHQKGIIHRDIKPSNILVTLHDGAATPKVIDFGVSKAISQQLTEKTLFTAFGQMVGTPQYMSPEQAEMSGLDIDTRSDVYSLGVLLYELLTGATPLDARRLRSAGYAEMQRLILEEDPPRPSDRISTLGEHITEIAKHRSIEARKLRQELAGELDWIVMKALEKDRARRYETASGFAVDIQRFLRDEPVLACPPSAAYRFRKFARRNKAAVGAAAFLATCLVAAVIVLAFSNSLIRRESNAKEKALGERNRALTTAREQEGFAKKNAARAEEQRGFAVQNAKEANAQSLLARRRFHAAQTSLAMLAFEAGHTVRAVELLETNGRREKTRQRGLGSAVWGLAFEQGHRSHTHAAIG